MTVKIVKKEPTSPVMKNPVLENQIKVGDCIVSPVLDFNEERGTVKFLVNIHKKGLMFRLVKSAEGMLYLESKIGVQFESKINGNISKNYMIVKCTGKAKEPSPASMDIIQRLVAKVSTETAPDDVKPPKGSEKVVEPVKKFGGVKITRRS